MLVAVKVLRQSSAQRANAAALAEFRQEAETLQSLRHPCILNFYGACFDCEPVRHRAVAARCSAGALRWNAMLCQ